MKFKLDENFGTRAREIFQEKDHDVQTVHDEGLQGSTDQNLYDLCCNEQRCLITLDLDFADVLRFPPRATNGIAVIRVPRNPSLSLLKRMTTQLLQALSLSSIEKQLWIVEANRIRVHQLNIDE